MTGFAAYAMWLVREDAGFVFWFGVLAHIQLIVCLSGFMALFVRRNYDIDTAIAKLKITDSVHMTTKRKIENVQPDDSTGE